MAVRDLGIGGKQIGNFSRFQFSFFVLGSVALIILNVRQCSLWYALFAVVGFIGLFVVIVVPCILATKKQGDDDMGSGFLG